MRDKDKLAGKTEQERREEGNEEDCMDDYVDKMGGEGYRRCF